MIAKQQHNRRCTLTAHTSGPPVRNAIPRRPGTVDDASPDARLPIVATPGTGRGEDRTLGPPSPERAYFVDEGPPVRTDYRVSGTCAQLLMLQMDRL